MRILFVVPYTPNLVRVRPYNFIRALSRRGHDVTVLTLTANAQERAQALQLASIVEVISRPLPRWRSLFNALRTLPTGTPLQATYCWQPALAADLLRLVRQNSYDVVHVEHLRGANYGLHLGRYVATPERPPIIWDSVDCITHLFRQASTHSASLFGRFITRLELARTERYERWLPTQFDRVLVTSPSDRRALLQLAGNNTAHHAPISVIPNGVDLDYFRPPGTPRDTASDTLVFSGKMSYHANITMAHYLVHEIMPLVWSHRHDVQLTIVGKDPPREVMAFAGDNRITVTGTVPDVRPYLQRASIAVAPLRYGAGIQNKILEAMACGTATITTNQALAALSAVEGQQILVADDAPAFAAAILSLLSDAERRRAIAAAGLDYVQQNHDWHQIVKKLEDIYRSAIT